MNDMSLDPSKGVFDPLNTDFNPDAEDIRHTVANDRMASAVQINRGLENNPDDAAESMHLSDITGVPPEWVQQNLDETRDNARRQVAQQLVLNNPELVTYLQSHPLASSVSNDDWGNLDKYTREAQTSIVMFNSLKNAFNKIGEEELTGLQEGWNAADQSQEFAKLIDPTRNKFGILGASASSLVYGSANLAMRSMGAMMGLATGTAKGIGEAIGGEQMGRGAQELAEWAMIRGDQPFHEAEAPTAGKPKPSPEAELAKHDDFMAKVGPWLENGIEPPPGVHPLLDQAKIEANAKMVEAMEEAFATAQASLTKERSPESFERVSPSLRDVQFDITGDAALALYGDKPSTPDDGLLGWVPGIESQLAGARDIGAPITVKMSDWMAHADPQVAKALRDDLRMWPGGITANEAKEPIPPKEVIDAPLPAVRDAAGLEPKFSMGDRKLTLMKGEPSGEPADSIQGRMDNYTIHDENGQPVGNISIGRGDDKELLVDWIGGQAGLWSNSFGPALMRDLKRQLKALYPDYDYLTGYRVSGARHGPAGTIGGAVETAVPRVKLDVDDPQSLKDFQNLNQIFGEGWSRFRDSGIITRDTSRASPEQLAFGNAAEQELQKLTGGVEVKQTGGIHDTTIGADAKGAYVPGPGDPAVLLNILDPSVQGVTRHEAIHVLRDRGLLTPDEWGQLHQAAVNEDWLGRYRIADKYRGLTPDAQIEEAVAEGFREWMAQADDVRPKTGIGAIFQKIMEFFDRVKARMGFGADTSWEQVFEKIRSGEVGERGPGAPRREVAFDLREKFSSNDNVDEDEPFRPQSQTSNEGVIQTTQDKLKGIGNRELWNGYFKAQDEIAAVRKLGEIPDISISAAHARELYDRDPSLTSHDFMRERIRYENRADNSYQTKLSIEGDDNLRAQSVGLPLESFRKLQEGWRAQHEAEVKAGMARAERDQTRRQTKEWRANRADMAKEVSAEISQRPDVMADAFIGGGELGGKKLQQRFTLRGEDLTPEQRAALPDHYTSANGLPADQVAGMFGYGSKDELVEALGRVNAMKEAAATQPSKGDYVRQLVQSETDRRMELRYWHLDENIMSEAQDQALSTASMNVMHDELMAQALKGGVTAFDKDVIQNAAKSMINEYPLGQVNSWKLMQLVNKHSRDAEKAKLAGDDAGMAIAMQKQTVTAYVAKEAKAVEKEMKQFDRVAKTMSKRERPSMAPEYANWIHQILTQIGKPVQRTAEDLEREIAATGITDLKSFVNDATTHAQVMEVWDQLFDKDWNKPYKDLTVPEFRSVRDSIKTIAHNGREERKLINAGNEADADVIKKQLAENLQQFPEAPLTIEGEKSPPGVLRHTWARLLTVQTILNRWDKFDWKGAWQQSFYRPLSEGANQLAAWEKEMAKTFRDIVNRPSDSGNVENRVFRNPINGELNTMTRENLRAVMLYMGSESGFDKLVRGYSLSKFKYTLTRDAVKAWVDSVATKEDWDFAESIWKSMEVPKEHSSTMYRSMSDLPMQGIEAVPIDTPFGKRSGGYVPIRYSKFYEGKSGKLSGISLDGLFGSGYSTGFAPDATYKIERTGYAAPLDLTLDSLVPAVRQQLRDAALRPALANASKILRDPDIAAAIKSRYGSEYHDMLKEYLRRLAGTENRGGPQGQYTVLGGQTLNMARENLVATLVGFNPGTVMKHGMTAFFLSANEVGPFNMLRAMRQLYEINDETGLSWRRFAYENSQELQRRDRNWRENLYGSTDTVEAKGAFQLARQQFITWGSKPVAMADALSSEPTWLAAYSKARDEGGSHGDGIFAGDRAVQRAHGSTSDAAKPMIMSHLSPWLTAMYNFFNDILNRAVETTWKAGEMVGAVKDADWSKAGKLAPGVAAGVFVTAIWTAVVENLVSPVESEPGDSTAKRALKGSVHSVAAMFPVIRDFAAYVIGGNAPDIGLLTTEFKAFGEVLKDFEKKAPFNGPHAEKLIRDFGTSAGALTGLPGMQIGREAGFAYGLASGQEHPRGPWGWMVGGRFGTIHGHSPTFSDYMAGRSLPSR